LFWTVPFRPGQDDESLTLDLDHGKARMKATDLHVRDFFNIPNALLHLQKPVSVPATVSFDIRWMGPATHRMRVTKPRGSTGHVFTSPVTMTWTAANGTGFSFKSNPSHTRSFFGQLGHIRNGVFSS